MEALGKIFSCARSTHPDRHQRREPPFELHGSRPPCGKRHWCLVRRCTGENGASDLHVDIDDVPKLILSELKQRSRTGLSGAWSTVCKFWESSISIPVHAIWSFNEISVGFSSVLVLYHEMISIWNSSVWKLRFTAALLLFYSKSGIMLPLLWTDQSSGLVCLSTIIHTSSRSNLINCPGLLHICSCSCTEGSWSWPTN